jgi:hypothetical protein
LSHAGCEAGLPDQRRLLVTGNATNRHRGTQDRRLGQPEFGIAIEHVGQNRARHLEEPEQIVVEGALADVIEQRSRGVGGIGRVHATAGQAPDQKGVDGAKGEVAGRRQGTRTLHMLEEPGDLARGKVGIEQEARAGGNLRLVPLPLESGAQLGRAPVLPNDGTMDRLARAPVPQQASLALIGDAEPGDAGGGTIGGRRAPAARSPPWCARCPRARVPPSPGPGSAG